MENPFLEITSRLDRIEAMLAKPKKTEQPQAEYWTIDQAAEFLNKAVPTLYGLVHRKILTPKKRGNRLYFKRTDLINWLESGNRNSQ